MVGMDLTMLGVIAVAFIAVVGAALSAGLFLSLMVCFVWRAFDSWTANRDIHNTWKNLIKRRLG